VPDTVAIKRLSAVEVDASASHQREFHADRLGRELGLDGARLEGDLLASYYPIDGEPQIESTSYTYYQARKPPRSEFRLYPHTGMFQDEAHEGDLLVVFRSPAHTALRMVAAERGSRAELELLEAFFARDVPSLDRFRYVESPASSAGAQQLALALTPTPPDLDDTVAKHPTYRWALDNGEYPTTAVMAVSAREIADVTYGQDLDPDSFLDQGLAAETRLFFAIEQKLAAIELAALTAKTTDVSAILEWSTRRLNSRKSRRGRSLQRHLEALLTREQIPFSPECPTEEPPPVDVMVPSCHAYADPAFPPDRLRAISCKSTLKERWMEIVPEARRVHTKFVLTLDDKLTDNVIESMVRQRVRPFMPARVLETYARRHTRPLLSSVSDLLDELRLAVA
jgi:hypothetical protein